MYRYSRGQPGQGALPRPAWGSGSSHGARTASPEPGSLTGSRASGAVDSGATGSATAVGGGSAGEQPPKDTSEVILQLENELLELRNACSWKDQRIAELERADVPAGRLKRDIRHLAAELHHTRKELSESVREVQELRAQLDRSEGGSGGAHREIVDSPSAPVARGGATPQAGADRGTAHQRQRIAELEEENRQLRESVLQLKATAATSNAVHNSTDGLHHTRQPSGASTQRVSDVLPTHTPASGAGTHATSGSGGGGSYPGGGGGHRQPPYMGGGQPQASAHPAAPAGGGNSAMQSASAALHGGAAGAHHGGGGGSLGTATPTQVPLQDEPLRQIVYSPFSHDHTATIGPTTLQGVGTVDGVASVAKVLLQRIHSSVCSMHRRGPPPQMMAGGLPVPGQPMPPGQLPMMTQMGLPQTAAI